MKNTFRICLNDLITPDQIESLKDICDILNKKSIRFILVGALARDILLLKVYNLELMTRATADIDIAIIVKNWIEYEEIINILIKTKKFSKSDLIHRLLYNCKVKVDIIPFGEIAVPNDIIKWPPDYSTEMSMFGFNEVYENAIKIIFENKKLLKVASLEGITILKIVAWSDKKRQKDALDIGLLLKNCFDAYLNLDEFKGIDNVNDNQKDINIYGPRIMGNKISSMLKSDKIKDELVRILEREISKTSGIILAAEMSDSRNKSESYEFNLKLLKELKDGIIEP